MVVLWNKSALFSPANQRRVAPRLAASPRFIIDGEFQLHPEYKKAIADQDLKLDIISADQEIPFQFKKNLYQNILAEWENRQERFEAANTKQYPNPFLKID